MTGCVGRGDGGLDELPVLGPAARSADDGGRTPGGHQSEGRAAEVSNGRRMIPS